MGLSDCQVNIPVSITSSLHVSLCIGINPIFMFFFPPKKGKDNVDTLRYIYMFCFSIVYFLPLTNGIQLKKQMCQIMSRYPRNFAT